MKLFKSLLSVAFVSSVFASANVHADAAKRIANRQEKIKKMEAAIKRDELRIQNAAKLDELIKSAEAESNVIKKCEKIGVAQREFRKIAKGDKPKKTPFDGKGPALRERIAAERDKVKKMSGGANCAALKDIVEVVQESQVDENNDND